MRLPLSCRSRCLLLYADDALAPLERSAVERHLGRCVRCSAEVERHQAILRRLAAWPVESSPPPLPELRAEAPGVDSRSLLRLRANWRWGLVSSAVALLLAALVISRAERLQLLTVTGPASPFEQLALLEHDRGRGAADSLELRSAEAWVIRDWLRARGYHAALVGGHPGSSARFALLGASLTASPKAYGAAVHAAIDGRRVTLLVGRAREVSGIPNWSLFGKKLQIRRNQASSVRLLSWKNAGKAYTLVTDPELSPRLACQLCHTDARRLATIERVAGEL